jgi:hypoxanthine-guanine phosphoribosyltransferase
VPVRYRGFAIEDKFVIGYGWIWMITIALPFIGSVNLKKFEDPA